MLTTSVSGNNGISSHSLRVPLLVALSIFFVGFSEERIKTKTRIEKQKQYSTLRYFELGIIYSNTLRTYLGIYAWVLTTSVSGNNGISSHSLRVPLLVALSIFLVGFSEERIKTKTRIEKQKQYSTLRYFELGIIYSNKVKVIIDDIYCNR